MKQNFIGHAAILVLITSPTATAGWFDSTPSESQAKAFWSSQIGNSNGLLRMTSFKKTDGKTISTPVGNVYALYYTLTFEATDDCQYSENFQATRGLPQNNLDSIGAFGMGRSVVHKGTRLIQEGEMDYEKRESGWVLVNTGNSRIFENPADVQARAEEAAGKKAKEDRLASEKQAHLDALTAKAKERHNTLLEKPLLDFTTERAINGKIVLSDCDLTSYDSNGAYTFWFVDMKQVQRTGKPNWMTIVQKNGRQVTFKFVSPADVTAFNSAFEQSYLKWRGENTELMGPAPMGAPSSQAPAPALSGVTADVRDTATAFPGERFPQTRTRVLTAGEVNSWSDSDLSYAFIEMFARYGDSKSARIFSRFSWYRERTGLTNNQIAQTLFSDIERQNAALLFSILRSRGLAH